MLLVMMLGAATMDVGTAEKFAALALACVHRQYPNKIGHVLNSDKDVRPPRDLTPAFYGCFDWHSSVHGHWLLARVERTFPGSNAAAAANKALGQSLTAENLLRETEYLNGAGRASFERPYGLAWLLQLAAELRTWDDAGARAWVKNIAPLEAASVQRISEWIRKLPYPVRSGEHSNTAFGLGLMLDYARDSGNAQFRQLLVARTRAFYGDDKNCPLNYEPSGEDFLSPCLAEADVMRRVLPAAQYGAWLAAFLPAADLKPAVSADPTDGKLAHLDGLNLSRAWMLRNIAAALPAGDRRVSKLRAISDVHAVDGLRAVTGAHYEGGHWLGSFAVYLLTDRGMR